MDILAHSLWAALFGKVVKSKKQINIWWTAFWGIFPDIIAFLPLVIWMGSQLVSSPLTVGDIYNENLESGNQNILYDLKFLIYPMSHSLILFSAVFGISWFVLRRTPWELSGWAVHILLDIPTHSGANAVQFLYPLSSMTYVGIYWREASLMAINYSLMIGIYGFLYRDRIANFARVQITKVADFIAA